MGLKGEARRRYLPITEDMAAVLLSLKAESKCQHVFSSLHDRKQPLSGNTRANQPKGHRGDLQTFILVRDCMRSGIRC